MKTRIHKIKFQLYLNKKIEKIISMILSRAFDLTQKEYSNYIIQHILEKGLQSHKDWLLNDIIKVHFIELSKNQFASFKYLK